MCWVIDSMFCPIAGCDCPRTTAIVSFISFSGCVIPGLQEIAKIMTDANLLHTLTSLAAAVKVPEMLTGTQSAAPECHLLQNGRQQLPVRAVTSVHWLTEAAGVTAESELADTYREFLAVQPCTDSAFHENLRKRVATA
jgi:hypothetical protein